MGNIFLSIIVPVYNAGMFLHACIGSIAAADLDSVEVILVDDGSTDNSVSLCKEYINRYPYMRLLSMPNCGPSAARNRAMDASNGEYIAFVDSDDYIDPAAFRRTVECLKKYPDGDIWVSDFKRVSDSGCVLDRVYQIENTPEPIENSAYLTKFLSARDCVWNVWRYIFKKKFLLDKGLRFEEGINCAEDLYFSVMALMSAEKLVFFHNPYYYYRVNYGNTLTRIYTLERVKNLLDMLQRSANYLKSVGTADAQLLLNKIARELFLNISLLRQIPDKDRAEAECLMNDAKWLITLGNGTFAKAADMAVSFLGVGTVSGAVVFLKTVKRRLRGMKTRLHGINPANG